MELAFWFLRAAELSSIRSTVARLLQRKSWQKTRIHTIIVWFRYIFVFIAIAVFELGMYAFRCYQFPFRGDGICSVLLSSRL